MRPGTVLVTGVNGFVGQHLVHELVDHGLAVIGVSKDREPANGVSHRLDEYHQADLVRGWPRTRPVEGIVHLAALSAVGRSFAEPQEYLASNSAMVTHLGEHLLSLAQQPRVLLVSSGAVYDPDQSQPIKEDGRLAFNSPYVVSKVLAEHQASYYVGRGLDWIVVRPFNHIGPGQSEGFLLPDLFAAIRLAGDGGRVPVGDLTTRRDYCDVRDVARAYRLLLMTAELKGQLFNICSGRSVSGEELLAELCSQGIGGNVEIQIDPDRVRPNDPPEIVGDSRLLTVETGWTTKVPLAQSVADFVSHAIRPRWG